MNIQRSISRCYRSVFSRSVAWTLAIGLMQFSLGAKEVQAQVVVTNLITDDQIANPATLTDSSLQNAWGISYSPSGPFWISDNASGLVTLYNVNPTPSKVPLVISLPGDGSVTGQVFNATAGTFNSDNFLFVGEDGTISGWRGALGTTAETLQLSSADNVYKGAAIASVSGNAYLYAANFKSGKIDILKGSPAAPDLAGNFTDPGLPAGYAPFNIQNLNGTLYVTYALQDAAKHDDVAGAGHGFVDAFDANGNFVSRIATQGALNSPWGLAIAPAGFAGVAGDLLVGNFGDGTIHAFNLATHADDGPLTLPGGATLTIDGLWGLTVGNDGAAGSSQLVYFSAGPGGEAHGLFGSLTPTPEPSTLALGAFGMWALAAWRRAQRR
jgi:uncharacterized protein (TIGR03118 family)